MIRLQLSSLIPGVFLLLLSLILVNPSYAQTYSRLWGKNGELWDKKRIPDFTNAGYKSGQVSIPDFKAGVNVKDFGAVGDSLTDNTIAFRKAIAACGHSKAVFIPAGVYLITDTLQIRKSNIVLRGDKKGGTTIYFSKGIEELYPNYNQQNKNQTKWSWSGAMILFTDSSGNSGIEDLTVKFPDVQWVSHNFHEPGYNGVGFTNGAHNGWIRNVSFTNTDLAIWIGHSAHHITAENWVLNFDANRLSGKLNGHHGVNIYGGYNLLQDFEIKGKYQHDLSVESTNSIYNVFRNGKGKDICIDHHNHAQSNNLFTNIDAGAGTRIYFSGGNTTPRGICFKETFWNITAQKEMPYCNQYDRLDKHASDNVCVGIKNNLPSQSGDQYGNWFETIDPSELYPRDLYIAQMKYKRRK
jgi:hypothetical protein